MLRRLHALPITLYVALAIATTIAGAFGLYLTIMGGAMAIDSQGHLHAVGAGAARFAGGVLLLHIGNTIFMHLLNIDTAAEWNWTRGLAFMAGGGLVTLGLVALVVGLIGLQDTRGIIPVLFLQGQPLWALAASAAMLIAGGLLMEKTPSDTGPFRWGVR